MKEIGIYLGISSIAIVFLEDKKIVSVTRYSPEKLGGIDGSVTAKIEVLINKIARELQISKEDQIHLSVWDKDIIFRSFFIPLMSRKEITTSIEFEIEKYIPFRIGDLVWNYSYKKIAKEKRLVVSFVGMKKNIFTRLQETFAKLDLNLIVVEPACLSLLRTLRSLSSYGKWDWFALLDYLPQESCLTFFYHTLPIFNRTVLPLQGQTIDIQRVIEEVKFSLQYFKREYRTQNLEKLIVLADKENEANITSLQQELDIDVLFLTPQDTLNNQDIDLYKFKAYGTATFEYLPRAFIPYLDTPEVCFLRSKKARKAVGLPLLEGVKLINAAVLVIGLVITAVVLFSFQKNLKSLQVQLSALEQKGGEKISQIVRGKPLNALEQLLTQKLIRVQSLKNEINSEVEITPMLSLLNRVMPEGLWLEGMRFSIVEGKPVMEISGYVYLGDRSKESAHIDQFISGIANYPEVKNIFPQIRMSDRRSKTIQGIMVTYFKVSLY